VLKIGKNLFSVRGEIKPGDNNIEHKWNTGKVPYGELAATLEIFDTKGKQIASASQRIEKSDSSYFHEIDAAEARFKSEFMPLYKQCQKKKLALDYPTVTKTTLEQFFPLVRDDVRKDHTWRVKYAITDFKRSLDQAISDMKAYLADPQMVPNARRYVTSRTEIKDYHFEGKRIDSRGKVDYGPVFFTGFGHFSRLRIDMPRWPGY
jgi:hypothetical protein